MKMVPEGGGWGGAVFIDLRGKAQPIIGFDRPMARWNRTRLYFHAGNFFFAIHSDCYRFSNHFLSCTQYFGVVVPVWNDTVLLFQIVMVAVIGESISDAKKLRSMHSFRLPLRKNDLDRWICFNCLKRSAPPSASSLGNHDHIATMTL